MADYLRWDAHNFLHSDAYFHAADFRVAEPFSSPSENALPDGPPDQGVDVDRPNNNSLRWQVLGIIASVLEDSDPACAGARQRLRQCLAHNVGSPEKALLEHLHALHDSELHASELHDSEVESTEVYGSAPHGEPEEQRV
ncbi:hypothetical protein [Arthrobacter sp. NPDC057009]|uniref:hypothetical protein n=1 Tax=Arthrobacter sp. NPDC057009 TaxID=3345996 RepID=UPI00362E5217